MRKQIVFFLLIIATMRISGMELIVENKDVLVGISQELYALHEKNFTRFSNFTGTSFAKDIVSLAKVNKKFNAQFDYIAHLFVRRVAQNHAHNEAWAAGRLGFKRIVSKIHYFFGVARDKNKFFMQEDLQSDWYLPCIHGGSRDTLLSVAASNADIKKVEVLITAGVHFFCGRTDSSLACVARYRSEAKNDEPKKAQLLTIAFLLLEAHVNPDDRLDNICSTPLMIAVSNNDRDLVRLLLEHKADPYLEWTFPDSKTPIKVYSAFTINAGKHEGWLKAMVDEVAKNKK